MSSKKQPGFALTELMLTLGIGAVLLTIVSPGQSGGPQQSGALIASNERAAIAALRSIASAQAQLASSGAIDTDDDGVGEYGYLGELAGTAFLRVYDPVTDTPALDPGLFLGAADHRLGEPRFLGHPLYVIRRYGTPSASASRNGTKPVATLFASTSAMHPRRPQL